MKTTKFYTGSAGRGKLNVQTLFVLNKYFYSNLQNSKIQNLQIYSILEHVIPNFWAQQKYDLKILQIYRETRIYVLDPRNTRIENLQIYSVLEHVIPNFWAQQKDGISIFYNSTEKRAYMFWTLGT